MYLITTKSPIFYYYFFYYSLLVTLGHKNLGNYVQDKIGDSQNFITARNYGKQEGSKRKANWIMGKLVFFY